MRLFICICFCFCIQQLSAQATHFPANWIGKWKGELIWYEQGSTIPKKVTVEMKIAPTDSSGQYRWQLIYGAESRDNRPYTLKARDISKGHWVIDEHNAIVLDQYYIGGRLSGAFTVGSSTIFNQFWIHEGNLHIEYNTISSEPINRSGQGTAEIPFVGSYRVKGYQTAILHRE